MPLGGPEGMLCTRPWPLVKVGNARLRPFSYSECRRDATELGAALCDAIQGGTERSAGYDRIAEKG